MPIVVAPAPAHLNSNGVVSSLANYNSERGRYTYASSDYVFSIDGDGRLNTADDDAILEYYRHNTPVPIVGNLVNNAFFQPHVYGSLRKGNVNATLFSRRYAGYVLSALVSGYMYAAIEYALIQLDPQVLGLESTRELQGLLNLQWAVVLLLGVLSDAYAPFGYRRNAYIIFGWISASVLWTVLFLLFQFSTAIFGTLVPPSWVAVSGITAAMLALIIATNALDIRVIELSQQEELEARGRLVATYQGVRIGAQVLLHALVLLITSVSSSSAAFKTSITGSSSERLFLTLPFPVAPLLLHLALVALLPIPLLVCFASEEKLRRQCAAPHLLETCRQFYQCAQQKAIWKLIAFNCVLFFFTLLDYTDVSVALGYWTYESPQLRRVRFVVSDLVFVAALLLWRRYGVNANWVLTIALVIITWSLVYFVGNTLIAFDVTRFAWMPLVMNVLRAGLRVMLLLSAFVPTIEVAHQGSEGTIFGLLSSIQSIVKVLGAQLVTALRDSDSLAGIRIPVKDLVTDSSSVQCKVFWGILAMTGLKLLSLTALTLCPQQKLDAQQLRIYGGYSRTALLVLLAAYALSYPAVTYFQYRSILD